MAHVPIPSNHPNWVPQVRIFGPGRDIHLSNRPTEGPHRQGVSSNPNRPSPFFPTSRVPLDMNRDQPCSLRINCASVRTSIPRLGGRRRSGCHNPEAGRVQGERVCLCQPGRSAVPGSVDQSPAPGRLRRQDRREAAGDFPADFVMHSLRHTMLTRLGKSGVDAFTIMRLAGHSGIVVLQRYIHPTPEGVCGLSSACNCPAISP